MMVGRPELVEAIATAGGASLSRSRVDDVTRYEMEAGILDKIKGPKRPARASYKPKDGSAALLGTAARSASGAPDAFTALAILQAKNASGGIVLDPVGRLLPPLKVPTFDEDGISRIELHPFVSAFLGSISRLSPEEAAALLQTPEAESACLELNVDAETAVFRWTADGKEHWVRFEHPGTRLADIVGSGPPAYQTVTKLCFPLLFAVGRLFAAEPAKHSANSDPSSGDAPASADPEKGNAAPARAASLSDWFRDSRTRQFTPGKVRGEGEILKPIPLSRDRLLATTLEQDTPAPWPPPMT